MARLDDVAKGILRICSFDPVYRIIFNQFLIADGRPALIRTGNYAAFESVWS